MKKRRYEVKQVTIIFLVICVFVVSLSLWLTRSHVEFKEGALGAIGTFLALLFVVALFMERALDVFLTTWRVPEADKLDSQIRSCKERVKQFEGTREDMAEERKREFDGAVGKLERAESKRQEYRSTTQRIALWMGLLFGLIISAIGLRLLQTVLDPGSLKEMPVFQKGLLRIADVLLTGGVLAGGSEAIHKMIEAYRGITGNLSSGNSKE